MTTRLQTCIVYDKKLDYPFIEKRLVPVCPVERVNNKPIRLFKIDNSIITWENGRVTHSLPNGDTITWHTIKPTMSMVIAAIQRGDMKGEYIRFFPDGSVHYSCKSAGVVQELGADIPGTPEEGSLIEPILHNGLWFFL
jgi:hypothetical protein